MGAIGARQGLALVKTDDAGPAAVGDYGGDPIRVLHLLPDLAIGGGQTIVLHHLRHRDRSRFVVHVATLLQSDELANEYAAVGCPPIPLRYDQSNPVATVWRLVRLLRGLQIDVLHVHSGLDRKVGHSAALIAGVPVVGHLHSEWVHLGTMLPEGAGPVRRLRGRVVGGLRDLIERRAVRHYIAESVAVRELFRPLLGPPISVMDQSVSTDRITAAVAAGAGAERRRELGLTSDVPLLLNVSRMVDGKGQVDLVRVMARLVEGGFAGHLVLVGDGDRRPDVEAETARLGVGEQVHLLGNRFDIPDLLAMADIFVFASETEGFGLAVLEAMAAHLPVVAFRLPALEEFSVDGVTAVLLEPGDLDGFTAAVQSLLGDRQRASEMGRRAHMVVEERFSPAAVARSFEPVYETVAARPPVRRRRGRTPASTAPEPPG